MRDEFKSHESYYDNIKKRKELLNKMAYVSKKIVDDNYKVGYMHREEPLNIDDSRWSFDAGCESDDYINDSKNIALLRLYDLIFLELIFVSNLPSKEFSKESYLVIIFLLHIFFIRAAIPAC